MINIKQPSKRSTPSHGKSRVFIRLGGIFFITSNFIATPSLATVTTAPVDTNDPFSIQDFSAPSLTNELNPGRLLEDFSVQNQIRILISQGIDDLRNGKKQEGLDKLKQAWALDNSVPVAGAIIASTYLQDKNYKTALEIAQEIQKNTPKVPEGYTLAGIAYSGLDDQKQSQASFEKALQIRPGDPEAAHNLAALYVKQGDTDKAKATLNDALAHNPDHMQTIYTLANLEFKTNQLQKAISLLEQATAKHPDDLQPLMALAQMHLAGQQIPQAFTVMENALKQFPNNPELMQYAGATYLQQGLPDKALPILESAVKQAPESSTLRYNLALVYEQLKNFPQALVEINNALKLEPNFTSSKFVKARLLASTGQLDIAQKLLAEIETSNPKSANIPELKGRIAMAKHKPDEAIKYFEAAVKTQEDNPKLIADLALAQMEAKKIDTGFDTLRHWLEKHPNNNSVRIILADLLLGNGRYKDAQKAYVEVLKAQPDRIDASNNLAWVMAENGELDNALEQAEKTYALAPNEPTIMDTLATILLKKDQIDRATDLLRKAATISPNDTAISFHLAQALANSDKKQAITTIKTLLTGKKPFKERPQAEELLKKLESK